jgi:hypothetical protein
MTLQQRYLSIQAKLDTAYDDRLAGRISDELWLRKSREWEAELASARQETASHERASRDYATTGSRILELAKMPTICSFARIRASRRTSSESWYRTQRSIAEVFCFPTLSLST